MQSRGKTRTRGQAAGALMLAAALLVAGSAAAQDEADSMVGRFGPRDQRTVVTRRAGPGNLFVALTRTAGQCSGALSGPAKAYLSAVATLSRRDPASGTTCTIDLTYAPGFDAVEVKESAGCLVWHGMACDFQGRFKRSR